MDEKRKLLGNFEIFYENSIEKFNFIFIFENLLLKIEPSEITPLFYNNFFGFGGGGFPPFPPGSPLPYIRLGHFKFDSGAVKCKGAGACSRSMKSMDVFMFSVFFIITTPY